MMEKNCGNCFWHNNGCPSIGEQCANFAMWKPNYQTLESQLGIENKINIDLLEEQNELVDKLQQERNYSQKIQSQIFNRYAELFPNYAFVDCETAIDLMVAEIMTLRTEKEVSREALQWACNQLRCCDCEYCKNETCPNSFDKEKCLEFLIGQAQSNLKVEVKR